MQRCGLAAAVIVVVGVLGGLGDQPASKPDALEARALAAPMPKGPELLSAIRVQIVKGSPKQKSEAIALVRDLQAVALIPELVDAVADPTTLEREGDTGWGFVGHQAASTLGEIARILDGVAPEKRGGKHGRVNYSFFDDMHEGGAKLKASGRLDRVSKNWDDWWQKFRYGQK